jgi:hypothetical protein
MANRGHLQLNMDLEPQWRVLVFSLFKKFDIKISDETESGISRMIRKSRDKKKF